MPLVGHIVRQTMSRVPAHVSRDDLTSAGFAALVTAAHSFDAERGVTFAGYAAARVRGAILDELRSLDWASRSVRRRARELEEARNRLAAVLGRTPTNAEIASLLGMSVDDVTTNRDDVSRAVVMSLQGFGDTPLDDLLSSRAPNPEQMIEQREKIGYLVDAVAELPERLRHVVQEYFFAERPMAEIADELSVTESRVSQMRAEALVLLKDALNSALEPTFVAPHLRPDGSAARRRHAYFSAVASRRSVAARLSTPNVVDDIA